MKYLNTHYTVIKGKKRYIKLESEDEKRYRTRGANLSLLEDIGNKDPKDVMREFFCSMPEET
jgi:hypothetical protein